MTISLKPEIEKYVAERVRAGQYRSAEEAVNALLSSVIGCNGTPASAAGDRRNGLPVFSIPTGTAGITSDDVRRAEDEA
jgi:Arc/MetJ-type ribon-helix-helix transcriptional regulator